VEKGADEFTRIVRWGIPGWVALLAFSCLAAIDSIVDASDLSLLDVGVQLVDSLGDSSAAGAVLLVAAAIPLGYLIYQGYYYVRWNSPISGGGFLGPLVTGHLAELERLERRFDPKELPLSRQLWREVWIDNPLFATDHKYKWWYMEPLLAQVMQENDKGIGDGGTYRRYRYMHEIMHVLGASLGAIYISFVLYTFLAVGTRRLFFVDHAAISSALVLVLLFLLDWEDRRRRDREFSPHDPIQGAGSFRHVITAFREHPAELYTFLLGFIVLSGLPSEIMGGATLSDPVVLVSTCTLAFVLALPWRPVAGWKGVVALLSIELGMILVAPTIRAWLASLDWPYIVAAYFFLLGNLVLIRNRQNVRDHLGALQYYALRTYSISQAPSMPESASNDGKARRR
jgi:hypothetical protein